MPPWEKQQEVALSMASHTCEAEIGYYGKKSRNTGARGGHAKAIYLPKTRSTENPRQLLTLNRGKEQQPSAPKGKESMDVWCRHNRIQKLGVFGDAPCLSKHKLIAAFCCWTQSLWSTEGNTLGETCPVPIPTADRRGRPITNIISSTLQSKLMTNIK